MATLIKTRHLVSETDPSLLEIGAQEWLDTLASQGLVTRAHKHNIRLFIRFCHGRGVQRPQDVTTALIKSYIRERQETVSAKTGELLGETTIRHEGISIKLCFHWMHLEGLVESERLYKWKLPKAHKPVVYNPTLGEQRTALQAIHDKWNVRINPPSRFHGENLRLFYVARDQALAAMLMSTGMRIGEALRLKVESYDQERQELRIDRTKTDDPRAVPVSDRLAKYLEAWMRVRTLKKRSTDYLFVTDLGDQIDVSAWGKLWRGYLAFARSRGHDLPRITLHSLRHSAATVMATANLKDAQELLGHKNLTSTARYLHTTSERVRATHAAVDPLATIDVEETRSSTRKGRKKIA